MGYTKYIKHVIFLSFFTLFCTSDAFIYDIRVMRKWDGEHKHYSYFIGLGDYHDRSHPITSSQLKQIDMLVKKCVLEKTKLIIEDLGSTSSKGRRYCGRFYIRSTGGILGGLASKCKKIGLKSIDNVEYRFCRVISLAPIINNLHMNCSHFLPSRSLQINCFRKEILSITKEILGYKDSPMLMSWYKKCVEQTINSMKLLKFDTMSKMSIADYINANITQSQLKKRSLVKKLLTFDSNLLDAKIVHSIVVSPEKQNMLVIAGGSHIRNVSRILQTIGYTPVYQSKVLIKKEYSAKKSLECNITSGGYCCKPEPADLRVLGRFI